MGRFGPFVQIGTKDDEDKPRFAGLRPGQKMDLITHEQALELFKLPRKLGQTAAGEEITTNVGRFGPYVKFGAKYVSLKTDDPYEITPERALEVIREKEIADANRLILDFPDAGIQVLNGRFGPYITDKQRNAKIPKDRDPKSMTLEECQTMLATAPVRTFGRWGKKNAKAKNGKGPGKTAAPSAAAAGETGVGTEAGGIGAKAGGGAARKRKTPSTKPGLAPGTPQRLAAKASKAAANKKAPLQPAAAPKTAVKPKKSAAKKKT
jgi:DNA topoisomerase-1